MAGQGHTLGYIGVITGLEYWDFLVKYKTNQKIEYPYSYVKFFSEVFGIFYENLISRKRIEVKILVVNENEALSSLVHGVLSEAGHQVVLATNGYDAIGKVDSDTYDFVLIDLLISFVTAQELIQHIRNLESHYIKIIVISSVTLDCAIESAFSLGVDDYIFLPLKAKELIARIDRLAKYELSS